MLLLSDYPLQSLIIFSIAPTILGLYSYYQASQDKDKRTAQEQEVFVQASIRKGVVSGLAADIGLLCIILLAFSAG
jgi:hypothetical protein